MRGQNNPAPTNPRRGRGAVWRSCNAALGVPHDDLASRRTRRSHSGGHVYSQRDRAVGFYSTSVEQDYTFTAQDADGNPVPLTPLGEKLLENDHFIELRRSLNLLQPGEQLHEELGDLRRIVSFLGPGEFEVRSRRFIAGPLAQARKGDFWIDSNPVKLQLCRPPGGTGQVGE